MQVGWLLGWTSANRHDHGLADVEKQQIRFENHRYHQRHSGMEIMNMTCGSEIINSIIVYSLPSAFNDTRIRNLAAGYEFRIPSSE
jgi:hypothetical protein